MSFVKTREWLFEFGKDNYFFYDAEVLGMYWETKPEIIERLLPAPLKSASRPLVYAFLANYQKFSVHMLPYLEAGLFVRAEFKGREGFYCLSMPVTNDMAMATGREGWGFPKKMGKILFKKKNSDIEGSAERNDIKFFEVKAKLTETDSERIQNFFDELGLRREFFSEGIFYNFQFFTAPGAANPHLIKIKTEAKHHSIQLAEVKIKLFPSNTDPWSEVEIVKSLGGFYTISDYTLKTGNMVAELDRFPFIPYAFKGYDF